jgi:hypothetical protein
MIVYFIEIALHSIGLKKIRGRPHILLLTPLPPNLINQYQIMLIGLLLLHISLKPLRLVQLPPGPPYLLWVIPELRPSRLVISGPDVMADTARLHQTLHLPRLVVILVHLPDVHDYRVLVRF